VKLGSALESHPRHLALAALSVGLALGAAPQRWWLAAPAALGLALASVGAPRLALVTAAAVLAGTGVGALRIAAIDAPGARLRDGIEIRAPAHLLSHPRPGRFGAAAEVRIAAGRVAGARLLARFPRGAPLPAAIGARLELAGAFHMPRRRPDDSFDYAALLRRRGVAGELRVTAVRSTARSRDGPTGALDRARRRSERAIARALDPESATLVRGMVLGQDEAVDPATRQDFRDSGLGHVLAVSGQNVMLLAALALPLLAAARLDVPVRFGVTILLIALYVPLAGAGPSLQRAGVMGIAGLLALGLARPASRWYALLLACAVTLLVDPRAVGDPGWQLSFAAVGGILLLAPGIRRPLAGLPRGLADGIAMTVAATLATAPLAAHHFGSLSAAAIPSNLVALPLVAPIMWLGMVDLALAQVAAAGGPIAGLADLGIAVVAVPLGPLTRALAATAAAFADVPGATIGLPIGSRAGLAGAYLLLAAMVLVGRWAWGRTDVGRPVAAARWRRAPREVRALVVLAVAVALALGLLRILAGPAPPDRLTVSFLDVGQGDATLIQDGRGANVLFDGGPPEGQVVRSLRRAGVRRLAVLVITHHSRDHHGGLLDVVRRFPVGLLLDGGDGTRDPTFLRVVEEARARGARRVPIVAPLALRAGALRIRFLSPPPRPPGPVPEDPNPRAAVATVSAGDFDLFLSADAEPPTLLGLDLPDVDAMKAPHHGSADPGLPQLLARLRPEAVSIPVGKHNGYGHPAPSTLGALRRARIPTWRNDRNGTVRLTVERGRVRVRPDHGGAIPLGP
jgi:competence protein ComEC